MSAPDDPTQPVPHPPWDRPAGEQPAWESGAWGQQPPPPPPAAPYGYPPSAPPGAPAYGYPAYPPPRPSSGRASTVLVLGIVSLVTFFALCGLGIVPAIIALAMAPGARREIEASGGVLDGASQVRTGTILAWVTVGLTALVLLAVAGFIALVVTSSSSSSTDRSPAPAVSQVTPG